MLSPPPAISARSVDDCVTGRGGITTGMPGGTGTGTVIVKLSLTFATPPPAMTYGMMRVVIGISMRTLVVKIVARPLVPDADPFEAMSVDWSSAATSGFSVGTDV